MNANTHNLSQTNTVAPYIGMIACTVTAVKVRGWIGAPTMCNFVGEVSPLVHIVWSSLDPGSQTRMDAIDNFPTLLPIDSLAGIGVLRTGFILTLGLLQ